MQLGRLQVIKTVLLVLAEVEMLFFSGIAFGMNSLFPTLSNMSYFCTAPGANATCAGQQQYFGYLLITMIISYSLIAVPIGVFYDIFGNFKTKIIAAILLSLGCLAYALSSVTTNFLAYLAALLLGAWAQTILTCNFALTSYYPSFQNKIVSIFSGSFDSSNFMMTFITLGYRGGISILASFLILTFVGLALCLTTAILSHLIVKTNNTVSNFEFDQLHEHEEVHCAEEEHHPKDTLHNQGSQDPDKNQTTESKHEDHTVIVDKTSDEFMDHLIDLRYPTLRSVLLSRHYILQVSYLTILFFRFAFFLAELNLQLNNLFPGNADLVNGMLFNSSFVFVCAIAISPLPGIVVDSIRKSMKPLLVSCEDSVLYGTHMMCFSANHFFCTTLGLIMSILILIPTQAAIYCSFVCFMLMRVILFSTNSTFFLLGFPKKYFGKIFGIGVLVSGGMSFIQYGLLFQSADQLNMVNYILIAIVAVTYIHPLLLVLKKS